MRIREEIEGLSVTQVARPQRQVGYTKEYDDYIKKADVLSILDEHLGECVAEGEYGLTGELRWTTTLIDGVAVYNRLATKRVKPGDHISIYVRRKKNESSS